jgi:Zn finger protein HypA/HybF involved in hydrogenase expression
MEQTKNKKCVMCGQKPEARIERETGKKVLIYFKDPKTNEQLCDNCNKNNDDIYKSKGLNLKGTLHIIKLNSVTSL